MAIAHPTAIGNQQPAQAKKKAITCSSEAGAIVKNEIKILVAGFKFAIKNHKIASASKKSEVLLAISQVQASFWKDQRCQPG